jgi:hypothetical protein
MIVSFILILSITKLFILYSLTNLLYHYKLPQNQMQKHLVSGLNLKIQDF